MSIVFIRFFLGIFVRFIRGWLYEGVVVFVGMFFKVYVEVVGGCGLG